MRILYQFFIEFIVKKKLYKNIYKRITEKRGFTLSPFYYKH